MSETKIFEAINKIEAVSERDIDLLLLEELNVSDEFALWLLKKIFPTYNKEIKIIGAWHSISDVKYGESDLIIKYSNGLAILVENKIDAPVQPGQSNRYKKRGSIGIENKSWESFVTCMIAPKLYFQKEMDSKKYDYNISYEDIKLYFLEKAEHDKRSKYKAFIMNEAIEQNRRGYTIIPNEKVTVFWRKYWEFSSSVYEILIMKEPGNKPTYADWPEFKLDSISKKMKIVHKLEKGYVDLQIAGANEDIEKIHELIRDPDLLVVKAGKSAAVRCNTGKIDRFGTFESQKDKIINGLDAAIKLYKIAVRIAGKI